MCNLKQTIYLLSFFLSRKFVNNALEKHLVVRKSWNILPKCFAEQLRFNYILNIDILAFSFSIKSKCFFYYYYLQCVFADLTQKLTIFTIEYFFFNVRSTNIYTSTYILYYTIIYFPYLIIKIKFSFALKSAKNEIHFILYPKRILICVISLAF